MSLNFNREAIFKETANFTRSVQTAHFTKKQLATKQVNSWSDDDIYQGITHLNLHSIVTMFC